MTEDQYHHHGLSLRKALAYTDCSRNTYYYNKKKKKKKKKKKRPRNTRRQCQLDRAVLEKKVEEIITQGNTQDFGTANKE